MTPEPPLLLIGKYSANIDLVELPWPEQARKRIAFNDAKFAGLELLELIVDGMPFLLTRCTEAEISLRFSADYFEPLFCEIPSPRESAIGVIPGGSLAKAAHLMEVNRRLLLIGKWIGNALDATAAAWVPSRRLASFSYFNQTVGQYLADGPLPVLFQTSFSRTRDGGFVTCGLAYFTGQEIRLTAPCDYDDAKVAKRLMRIIHELATHGRIHEPTQLAGFDPGEILLFSPGQDMAQVEIVVEDGAPDAIAVRNLKPARQR